MTHKGQIGIDAPQRREIPMNLGLQRRYNRLHLGVLLDAFVAVFVMSIATYHISREFEHLDADQLDTLKG